MSYADKSLACRDCGQAFTFTVGEQEFFASRGFTNEPSRCEACRADRKASRGSDSYCGGCGRGGYSSGGGGGYSSGVGGGGGGYGRDREMFSATCSSCGNEARVPFQPRGDKPGAPHSKAPAADPKSTSPAKADAKVKTFDFDALDLNGRMRAPQLLYFLERANEELERASLERRSFIPQLVRTMEEQSL